MAAPIFIKHNVCHNNSSIRENKTCGAMAESNIKRFSSKKNCLIWNSIQNCGWEFRKSDREPTKIDRRYHFTQNQRCTFIYPNKKKTMAWKRAQTKKAFPKMKLLFRKKRSCIQNCRWEFRNQLEYILLNIDRHHNFIKNTVLHE